MFSLDYSMIRQKLPFLVVLFATLCHGLMATAHQGPQAKQAPLPVTIQNYNIQGPVQLTHGNPEVATTEYKASHPPHQHPPHQPYSTVVSYPDSRYPNLPVPAYVVTAYKAELKHHEAQQAASPVTPNAKPQVPYYVMPYYNHHQPYPAPVYSGPVAYQPSAQHVAPYQHHVPVYQTIQQAPVYVPQHHVVNASHFVAPVYQQVAHPYIAYSNHEAPKTEVEANKQKEEMPEFVIHHAISIAQMEEKSPEEQTMSDHAHEEQVEMHREEELAVEKAPVMEPVPSDEHQSGASTSEEKVEDSVQVFVEPAQPAIEQIPNEQELIAADVMAESLKEMETESQTEVMTEQTPEQELVVTWQPEMEIIVATEMPVFEEQTEATLVTEEPSANVAEPFTEYEAPATEQTIQEAVGEEQQTVSEAPIVPLIYRENVEKKTETALPALPLPLIYRNVPQVKIQQPQQPAVTVLYRQQVTRKQPAEALPGKVAQVLSAVRGDSEVASSDVTHVKIFEETRSVAAAEKVEQPIAEESHQKEVKMEMMEDGHKEAETMVEEKMEEIEPTTQSTTPKRSRYTTATSTTTTTSPLPPVRTRPNYKKYRKQPLPVQKATPIEEESQIMEHFDVMESGEEVDDYSDEEYSLPIHQMRMRKPAIKSRTHYQRPYPIVAKRQRPSSKTYRPSKAGMRKESSKRLPIVREESESAEYDEEMKKENGSSCDLLSKIKAALVTGDERDLPPGVAIDRKKQRAILAEGFALYYFGDETDEEAFH